MKKFMAFIVSLALAAALCGCGSDASQAPAGASDSGKVFNIGICQLAQHPALDSASQGFADGIKELFGDRAAVTLENASGDSPTCSVICGKFVSDEADLIMANATASLQAAASATNEIPILGTSITDYGTALGADDWTGVSGTNISGTSDLAPLEGQAEIIKELFPDAETVGMLFCSGEPNSRFQVDAISLILEDMGCTVKEFSFADTNDVSSVTATACAECDLLFVPTDNTAASCGEAINNVAINAGTPIVCGEENSCRMFGAATLSISYYDLGRATAQMAYDILIGGEDISQMEIRFAPEFTKLYNPAVCEALGISVPDDFAPVSEG